MVTSVEVPKLGNAVEDCLLSAWRKHKGDIVAAGDVVAGSGRTRPILT